MIKKGEGSTAGILLWKLFQQREKTPTRAARGDCRNGGKNKPIFLRLEKKK